MPKISIITPTYNRADMLGDAIQSVLDQTYGDWELIVVDDGSRDNTQDVVAKFADARIRYIYQDNKGLPGARNTGIRASQSEYVAFLDSDDLFLPQKLATQTEALGKTPDVGVVASGWAEVDVRLQPTREQHPWETHPRLTLTVWAERCPFVVHSALVRRAWLEKVGLFDETMRYVEDWDLWLRMALAGCPMIWHPGIVCLYRIHEGNMVRDALLMKAGMLTMFDKLYAQADLPLEITDMRNTSYATAYLNTAARCYAGNDTKEGKICLEQAVRIWPALLEEDPPRALTRLASFALTPLVEDSERFMDTVVENLPPVGPLAGFSKRRAHGLLHAVAAFDYHRRQMPGRVVQEATAALWTDPRWMRNRGLLKILAQSVAPSMRSRWSDAAYLTVLVALAGRLD